ncbi:MAG: hypothetical protein LBL04_13075 [Bacteroidales bacterium]|jgi:hypothetical protein|nr:hypothetical protein [Bacteroidales bacterium]
MVFINILLDVGTETRQFQGCRQRDFFPGKQFRDFIREAAQLQAAADVPVRLAELFYQIVNRVPPRISISLPKDAASSTGLMSRR